MENNNILQQLEDEKLPTGVELLKLNAKFLKMEFSVQPITIDDFIRDVINRDIFWDVELQRYAKWNDKQKASYFWHVFRGGDPLVVTVADTATCAENAEKPEDRDYFVSIRDGQKEETGLNDPWPRGGSKGSPEWMCKSVSIDGNNRAKALWDIVTNVVPVKVTHSTTVNEKGKKVKQTTKEYWKDLTPEQRMHFRSLPFEFHSYTKITVKGMKDLFRSLNQGTKPAKQELRNSDYNGKENAWFRTIEENVLRKLPYANKKNSERCNDVDLLQSMHTLHQQTVPPIEGSASKGNQTLDDFWVNPVISKYTDETFSIIKFLQKYYDDGGFTDVDGNPLADSNFLGLQFSVFMGIGLFKNTTGNELQSMKALKNAVYLIADVHCRLVAEREESGKFKKYVLNADKGDDITCARLFGTITTSPGSYKKRVEVLRKEVLALHDAGDLFAVNKRIPYTPEERNILHTRQMGVCPRTNKKIVDAQDTTLWNVHHSIVPHSKGGSNALDNAELVCATWNKSEGDRG